MKKCHNYQVVAYAEIGRSFLLEAGLFEKLDIRWDRN